MKKWTVIRILKEIVNQIFQIHKTILKLIKNKTTQIIFKEFGVLKNIYNHQEPHTRTHTPCMYASVINTHSTPCLIPSSRRTPTGSRLQPGRSRWWSSGPQDGWRWRTVTPSSKSFTSKPLIRCVWVRFSWSSSVEQTLHHGVVCKRLSLHSGNLWTGVFRWGVTTSVQLVRVCISGTHTHTHR